MKHLFTFILFFGVCGCTTVEFVRKDLTPHKQGILRHSPPSSGSREAEYRDLVNEKARQFCGGDFTIVREYQALDESRSTAGVGTGFGFGNRSSIIVGGAGPKQTMYHFVEFICK